MQFFTAGDVLHHRSVESPVDPVTVELDDSIHDALVVMLGEDFDQLPVTSESGVEGAITYKSIARYIKAIDEPRVKSTSVKIVLEPDPVFVELDRDIFDLFETFAADDFVLIGDRDGLDGLLTRYDVFHFLEDQIDPILKIGEIEESLRQLIRRCCDDLDDRIGETFSDRAAKDSTYVSPEGLEDFSFDDYRMFLMRNLEQFPSSLSRERELVEGLLEDVRDTRNALFHFRKAADEVDRDQLDLAHGYFTQMSQSA